MPPCRAENKRAVAAFFRDRRQKGAAFRANAELAMCEKCAELDEKIGHYRMVIMRVPDAQTVEGINKLIEKMQAEKAALHPAKPE
jgi:predicted component of type VI protein secretion system